MGKADNSLERADGALARAVLLPEPELPDAVDLMAEGRKLARTIGVGPSPFLAANDAACEIAYKERRAAEGTVMMHAQVGYRDLEKSRRAYGEIHQRITAAGYGLDRYGICLDWSMGYAPGVRPGMPRGTGLILDAPEDFARLTAEAPVAPISATSCWARRRPSTTRRRPWPPDRRRSATSASTSPSACPIGTTT